ncbi:MAG: FtsW/RodA/SpoVE family cell cycle protein [Clostridiales bacterium]|nr:FtsW/RodA/SpoVE family cell cycle protein [Candidatus Crickella equi]
MEVVLERILNIAQTYPEVAKHCTTLLRWVFVVLAIYILLTSIMSLLRTRTTPVVNGYFLVEDGGNFPITHWENVIGRSKTSDITIPLKTVSKTQAILLKWKDDKWMFKDLGSHNGTTVNGVRLEPNKKYLIHFGDEIIMGGVHCTLAPASLEESANNRLMRSDDREPVAPWKILLAITLFQALTIVQLIIAMGTDVSFGALFSIALLSVTMWVYVTVFKAAGRKGFEMEMIAFFMSTINLAIAASSNPEGAFKQLVAIWIGIGLMIFMCIYMRDLDRTKKIRPILIGLSVLLLIFNLIFGTMSYGAANWVRIGGMSFQPSELVKLAFICVGAGTLEELFEKRNTYMYAIFSVFCLGCLALMGDFGTALIFFATYLVVSFLRSGDFSRLMLTGVGALVMGLLVLRFKPYIADRFATWGHAWEDPDNGGFQQTRTMSFGSGGGLLGHGAGNGSMKNLFASDTDLVFGFVMEEWGLIIALLIVICLVTLCMFAVLSIVAGRSTFYTIGACGAATMMLIQTMLNIFGSVDLFPLTGVTFPFVSTGGTSMMASWAMLAYFKAADMRKNASLAVYKED